MKYITFVVPCYNSQDYMERCLDSLLPCGEDGEIIVVDDGSVDMTGEIADSYEARYPGRVRVIHKENGGHGSAVNTGIACASGLFFKVVDSDDWVKEDAYKRDFSLRWWTLMTGWSRRPLPPSWKSSGGWKKGCRIWWCAIMCMSIPGKTGSVRSGSAMCFPKESPAAGTV